MNPAKGARIAVGTALVGLLLIAVAIQAAAKPAKDQGFGAKDVRRFTQEIARGKQAYADLDYETAVAALEPVLAASEKFPAATRADFKSERAEGYRYLAYSYVALEQFEKAEGAFRKLLELDPKFDPGDVSPKVRKVFAAAKGVRAAPEAAEGPPSSVEHQPAASVRAGQPLTIRANVRLEAGVAKAKVVLQYRTKSAGAYTKVEMLDVGEAVFVGVIPAKATRDGKVVQYYVTVEGTGAPTATVGTKDKPIEVRVTPAPLSKSDEPSIPEPRGNGDF